MQSFVYAVVMFCDGVSTLLYLLLTATSIFWLIFYKVCVAILFWQRRYDTHASIRLIASAITLSVGG